MSSAGKKAALANFFGTKKKAQECVCVWAVVCVCAVTPAPFAPHPPLTPPYSTDASQSAATPHTAPLGDVAALNSLLAISQDPPIIIKVFLE